jgi:hypothetical protein
MIMGEGLDHFNEFNKENENGLPEKKETHFINSNSKSSSKETSENDINKKQ